MGLISEKTFLLSLRILVGDFTPHRSLLRHSPEIQVSLSSRTVCWKMLEISWGLCVSDKCVFWFIFWLGKVVRTASARRRNGIHRRTHVTQLPEGKGFPSNCSHVRHFQRWNCSAIGESLNDCGISQYGNGGRPSQAPGAPEAIETVIQSRTSRSTILQDCLKTY